MSNRTQPSTQISPEQRIFYIPGQHFPLISHILFLVTLSMLSGHNPRKHDTSAVMVGSPPASLAHHWNITEPTLVVIEASQNNCLTILCLNLIHTNNCRPMCAGFNSDAVSEIAPARFNMDQRIHVWSNMDWYHLVIHIIQILAIMRRWTSAGLMLASVCDASPTLNQASPTLNQHWFGASGFSWEHADLDLC